MKSNYKGKQLKLAPGDKLSTRYGNPTTIKELRRALLIDKK